MRTLGLVSTPEYGCILRRTDQAQGTREYSWTAAACSRGTHDGASGLSGMRLRGHEGAGAHVDARDPEALLQVLLVADDDVAQLDDL